MPTPETTPDNIQQSYRDDHAATCVIMAKQWLDANPDDLWVTHTYAEMLYRITRYDEAIEVYESALERFPESRWGIYNQLGHLYRYRGAYEEAEVWYQKAIDEDSEEAASFIFLGAVQAKQGKLQEAEQTHRRATECPNGFIDEAYHNWGLVLRAQGRFSEAKARFAKAIEICPDYPEAIDALNDVTIAMRIQGRA